ncbi:MAG: helix-turn-helix transcriptional regulator [Taibaiella sp.]|nr:helix-turn-helix transcriptional regulator [Taibaiella sp.]
MYAVKESSTNHANKQGELSKCPVTFTLDRIGGRWKALILYHLIAGPQRYGALKKLIPAITEKMLIQQLKELEADTLVHREVKPVVPPHVTYSLTPAGTELAPVMQAMANWGLKYAAVEVG